MSIRDVPSWGIVSSAAPPVLLAAGWTIAAFLQSQPYDQVADTVSVLAGTGATHRWVMTLAFAAAGACEVVTGLALRQARMAGRLTLMAGGMAGVLVAASPVHTGGGAPASHILWSAVGLAALAVWPVAASRRGPAVPWALRPEISAGVALTLLGLLAWFGLELITPAGHAGLAERVLGEAQSGWPFVAVMSCRRPVTVAVRYRPLHGNACRVAAGGRRVPGAAPPPPPEVPRSPGSTALPAGHRAREAGIEEKRRRNQVRQSLRLGRVAGIPLGAHWTVAVILALIGWSLGAYVLPAEQPHQSPIVYVVTAVVTALLFAGSLLAHELAHAVVAKRNGVHVRQITLWMLGGVSELDGDSPNPGADLRIAVAGPAASAVIAGICIAIGITIGYAGGPLLLAAAAVWLGLMNGMLAVFNMLPGAPLDGGRVLRAALWHHYGDQTRAAVAAAHAGRVTGAVIVAAGVADVLTLADIGGLWIAMVGMFLFSAAGAEARAVQAAAALSAMRVRDVMIPDPLLAPAGFTVEEFGYLAARFRQEVFPVVDDAGTLTGVIFPAALPEGPPGASRTGTVGQAAEALPPGYLAAPADPAASLLNNPPLRRLLVAVVVDQGRVCGLVTVRELSAAVRRAGPHRPERTVVNSP